MDILALEYIFERLAKLYNNDLCCISVLGPFYNIEYRCHPKIINFGLKIQTIVVNGHPVKRIFNFRCCHCIDMQRSFHLSEESQKDVLYHLKCRQCDEFNQDVLPSSLFKPFRMTPVLPTNRFTIVPLRQHTFQAGPVFKEMVPKSWHIYPYKQELLEKIKANKIIVITGDACLEKSTAVPLTIIEESISNGAYSKILCVEYDNLLAITNSTLIADHLNERIGSIVGYQVYLQSRVCDSTNIIYTSAVFFLRVLMGQDFKNSFSYISHVVLSDVHLHHAYNDILIKELRSLLPRYAHIKLILLSDYSDNKNLLSYFGEGEEFCINIKLNKPNIYFMEEIIELVEQNKSQAQSSLKDILTLTMPNAIENKEITDNALEYYNTEGNETAFNNFVSLLRSEKTFINQTHSFDGYTALIVAVKHDNPIHIRWLLTYEYANPFCHDTFKINALEYAISIDSIKSIRALTNNIKIAENELKPPAIDFDLISKLICLITNNWGSGNILVFLPTHEHLLELNYNILRMPILGKIPHETKIYLLHNNMQPELLQHIIKTQDTRKIILATEMAESLGYLKDISYVIDSGQIFREKYRSKFKCIESMNEWVPEDSLDRRSYIASRLTAGHCFRLMSRKTLSRLKKTCQPELHYIPMNRISLTVKLLSTDVMVKQYFQDVITIPPSEHVAHSIQFLKDIEVLDSFCDVTWLGCRLIDIPINLELGKSLVVSILLKCLDPVLTIVSFLSYIDSAKLVKHKNTNVFNKKSDPSLLVDEPYSDHLELLRIYQNWQDDKRSKTYKDVISDEETFILNGVLENICELRTCLVGALRSSQLVHNQGLLSMHSINVKANNWAVIKAALAGGLYPKVCMINPIDNELKSKSLKLCINISSALHPSRVRKMLLPLSGWIVYFKETNCSTSNSISNCTLISPATVALIAGKVEMNPKNVLFTNDQAGYFIDENIWLMSDAKSALLTFKLRQMFYGAYMNYLQTCTNIEKWRKSNELPFVFDLICKILLQEDKIAGFLQPNSVGNRPKANVNKFTIGLEITSNTNKLGLENQIFKPIQPRSNNLFSKKEFFLINAFDSHQALKSFRNIPAINLLKDFNFKTINDMVSIEKLIYFVICSATRKRITHIALIIWKEGTHILRYCFQVNIPLHEVIITCTALKINLPTFSPEDWIAHKLDNELGEIILELWLHNTK